MSRVSTELTLLLDAHSLLFRAFYALPPMNTSAGEPTNALYGFSLLLVKLLREQKPTSLAVAFDVPGGTFRHDKFEGYKAGRRRIDDALVRQLRRLDDLIAAMGVPAHRAPGFEADDVIATLASRITTPIKIVSGDRDLFQLVDERCQVIFVGARGGPHKHYDLAAIDARFGLAPTQLPSFVALVGDPADNIPKVPGVGNKTASKLVASHDDIAGVLAKIDRIKPERVRQAIAAAAEQLPLSEELVRLRRDVPLSEPLAASIDMDGLGTFFTQLEFKSLSGKLREPEGG